MSLLVSDVGFLLWSEHRVGVGGGLGDRLDYVAKLDDLAGLNLLLGRRRVPYER